MNTKNVLMGGIAGGIAFFFLGWLIYGMLLMNYMMENAPKIEGLYRAETDFIWWALIASNLVSGLFIAYLFDLGKVSGWMNGFKTGAIIGILMSICIDLNYYSMTFMVSKNMMIVDVLASTVMMGIGGAVIAMVMGMGMGNKSAA